ncbi:MAG: hypothetical protein ABIN89_06340 [Chitinophagaceae bacterium]
MEDVLKIINLLLTERPEPNSIYIKFPIVKDFSHVAKYAHQFQLIIGQLIFEKEIDGIIEIKSVENGSVWWEVLLGNASAVGVVAGIAKIALLIHTEYWRYVFNRQTSESNKIEIEKKKELQAAHSLILDHLVQTAIKELDKEFFKNPEPERLSRIMVSVNSLSALMAEGAIIQPALSNSKEIINLFPKTPSISDFLPTVKNIDEARSPEISENK